MTEKGKKMGNVAILWRQTHSLLQASSQFFELLALRILQFLVILDTSQLYVSTVDLGWWAELLTDGGLWISIFNLEVRSRWEQSVWSMKRCKRAAFDETGRLGVFNRPGSTILKLYSVISSWEDSLALRAIKTASRIKRLFIKTSEAVLSDVCVKDKKAVAQTLWHFSPLHY